MINHLINFHRFKPLAVSNRIIAHELSNSVKSATNQHLKRNGFSTSSTPQSPSADPIPLSERLKPYAPLAEVAIGISGALLAVAILMGWTHKASSDPKKPHDVSKNENSDDKASRTDKKDFLNGDKFSKNESKIDILAFKGELNDLKHLIKQSDQDLTLQSYRIYDEMRFENKRFHKKIDRQTESLFALKEQIAHLMQTSKKGFDLFEDNFSIKEKNLPAAKMILKSAIDNLSEEDLVALFKAIQKKRN